MTLDINLVKDFCSFGKFPETDQFLAYLWISIIEYMYVEKRYTPERLYSRFFYHTRVKEPFFLKARAITDDKQHTHVMI